MQNSLMPFNELEQEVVKSALGMLASVDFFQRIADMHSLQTVNNFDSLPTADQLRAIQQLAGTRTILLSLSQDSKAMVVEETLESESEQPGDSRYVEEPLFPDVGNPE